MRPIRRPAGLLGWTSPLAAALIGARIGETVEVGGGRPSVTIEAIDCV
jgi:transcription elongation GreA/GreB family factor